MYLKNFNNKLGVITAQFFLSSVESRIPKNARVILDGPTHSSHALCHYKPLPHHKITAPDTFWLIAGKSLLLYLPKSVQHNKQTRLMDMARPIQRNTPF